MAKKYIGEIRFIPTGEVERFTEIDKFLSELRRLIDTVGVMGVNSQIYDKNNLDYQYEHIECLLYIRMFNQFIQFIISMPIRKDI